MKNIFIIILILCVHPLFAQENKEFNVVEKMEELVQKVKKMTPDQKNDLLNYVTSDFSLEVSGRIFAIERNLPNLKNWGVENLADLKKLDEYPHEKLDKLKDDLSNILNRLPVADFMMVRSLNVLGQKILDIQQFHERRTSFHGRFTKEEILEIFEAANKPEVGIVHGLFLPLPTSVRLSLLDDLARQVGTENIWQLGRPAYCVESRKLQVMVGEMENLFSTEHFQEMGEIMQQYDCAENQTLSEHDSNRVIKLMNSVQQKADHFFKKYPSATQR